MRPSHRLRGSRAAEESALCGAEIWSNVVTADGAEGGDTKQSLALEPPEDQTTRPKMLFSYLIEIKLLFFI